jgi:hypothetical protein
VSEQEIARAARAARRDNATDRVVAALTLFGLPYEGSRHVADTAIEAIAGWLRERGELQAATLVESFDPS